MGDKNSQIQPFEKIRQESEEIGEFWSARDLQEALGYSSWQKFSAVIESAKESFKKSKITINYNINDHFNQVVKMVPTGSGAERPIKDYLLSRYACYLIAQNGDSSKEPIALAQSYFNIQTFRQEQFERMSDDERRLYARRRVTDENRQLFDTARASGVEDYAKFNDAGYLGLYGMRNKDIVKKKGLGNDKLLDRAGSTELAANLFRITQTKDKLQNEIDNGKVVGENRATNTHFYVGRKVRKTIEEIGGTMPEDLPPEKEHIKNLKKRVESGKDFNQNKRIQE